MMKKHVIIGICSLILSSCVSIGSKPQPVGALLTLTADAHMPADAAAHTINAADAMSIAVPVVPQVLSYTRIPVYDGRAEITYLKGATWIEPPAHIFRALLSETIAAKTGRVIIDPRQSALLTGASLSGQLIKFGYDASSAKVVVTYDAVIAHAGSRQIAARRFQAAVPLTRVDGAQAGEALNEAANDVAAQVASWVAAN